MSYIEVTNMILALDTSSRAFRNTFTLSLIVFAAVLFAAATYSWTGPTGTAPDSNVSAPINVGNASQVKSGALSVNGLSVYGNEYISGNLGVGASPGSTWKLTATGGAYGIYAEAGAGQAIRGYAYPGYAGYFVGYGGIYAQNTAGYYAFLGYPGSAWSVYANGPTYTASYSRADSGFCIGGSCVTSFADTPGTLCGLASHSVESGSPVIAYCKGYNPGSSCPSGYSRAYVPIWGGSNGQSFSTCVKS